ncbi:hypothetical protein E4U32_007872 [Claviceps aff. humidiphila group G2b]|nr:hypothetical protein E4U32_007872 [Claviceps aff. humidiphila group G2b]
MSSKLDKPLDDIVSAKRLSTRNRRSTQRRSTDTRPSAPAGGIQKNSRPARGAAGKPALAKAITTGESKIIVSNLPKDVSEQQIKEYFVQVVGPIKRVDLVYGPNSMSRGIANVSFHKSDGASKAYQKLNGLLVDNRPIKIEIVVGAAHVDKVLPAVKSLAERTAQPKQPKAQPKSAASTKGPNNGAAKSGNGANGAANKKRRGRNARPVKKTADELDTEMANYFSGAADGANNAAAGGAANEASVDASMEDAILVIMIQRVGAYLPDCGFLPGSFDKLSQEEVLIAPERVVEAGAISRISWSIGGGAKYGSSAGHAVMNAPLRQARAASAEVYMSERG